MKFVEIVLLIICINTSVVMLSKFNIIPTAEFSTEAIQGGPQISFDENYSINSTNSILTQHLIDIEGQEYSRKGLDSAEITNMMGGDLPTGIFIFGEIIAKGIFHLETTLDFFHVPRPFQFIIVYPVWFMYAMAIWQQVLGRSVEADK